MQHSASASKTGAPTAVVVKIGFQSNAPSGDVDTFLAGLIAQRLACSGPYPEPKGPVWEIYLPQSALPDDLEDLEILLWDSPIVRQSVITYLPLETIRR